MRSPGLPSLRGYPGSETFRSQYQRCCASACDWLPIYDAARRNVRCKAKGRTTKASEALVVGLSQHRWCCDFEMRLTQGSLADSATLGFTFAIPSGSDRKSAQAFIHR